MSGCHEEELAGAFVVDGRLTFRHSKRDAAADCRKRWTSFDRDDRPSEIGYASPSSNLELAVKRACCSYATHLPDLVATLPDEVCEVFQGGPLGTLTLALLVLLLAAAASTGFDDLAWLQHTPRLGSTATSWRSPNRRRLSKRDANSVTAERLRQATAGSAVATLTEDPAHIAVSAR